MATVVGIGQLVGGVWMFLVTGDIFAMGSLMVLFAFISFPLAVMLLAAGAVATPSALLWMGAAGARPRPLTVAMAGGGTIATFVLLGELAAFFVGFGRGWVYVPVVSLTVALIVGSFMNARR